MADLVNPLPWPGWGLRCHAPLPIHPIAALQIEYSPWTIDIENNGILETAHELGEYCVCHAYIEWCCFKCSSYLFHISPLLGVILSQSRGVLMGRYKSTDDFELTDFRRFNPRFNPRTSSLSSDFRSSPPRTGSHPHLCPRSGRQLYRHPRNRTHQVSRREEYPRCGRDAREGGVGADQEGMNSIEGMMQILNLWVMEGVDDNKDCFVGL